MEFKTIQSKSSEVTVPNCLKKENNSIKELRTLAPVNMHEAFFVSLQSFMTSAVGPLNSRAMVGPKYRLLGNSKFTGADSV